MITKKVKLTDVCIKVFAGGDVPKDRYSETKTETYPIPIYANAEKDNGLYGYTDTASVEEECVTVAARGTIGFTAIRKEPFLPVVRLITVIPDQEKIKLGYLHYALRHLKPKSSGTSIPQLTVPDIKKYSFNITPIEQQERIITILDKTENLINLKKQELELLDDLIKSRFVEMFGDPVVNPMNWEKKQLQEVVTDDCSISYGIVQTGDDQEEGIPVFRPVDIVNRAPAFEELKRTTKAISDKYKRTILKGHEMLITVRANIADTCIVGEEFIGCNVGRGIVPIRTKEDVILLDFLKYQMDNKHLNDDIKAKAKGITLIQLNMEDLREIELIIPPIEIQKVFVEFAEQVDKSKIAIQKSLDETQLLFDSLMQKYFG